MDVIQYTVQYSVCCPVGRIAKQRSLIRNSCKMREYFWPWLVLSSADAKIFFAQSRWNFKDRSMLFQNKVKSCWNS